MPDNNMTVFTWPTGVGQLWTVCEANYGNQSYTQHKLCWRKEIYCIEPLNATIFPGVNEEMDFFPVL